MFEKMVRPKTPEEVRRLKAKGIFDVGRHYSPNGMNRIPKYRFWDRED